MAATAIVSPTSMYSNPPPPYSAGWPHPPSNHSSGLISPPEPRRTSDNKEPPPPIQTSQHRQSLPSIHEALSSGPKPNPYASPISASLTHSQQQLPFSSQASSIPRSYTSEHPPYHPAQLGPTLPRQPSPRVPAHPHPNTFGRPEPIPASFSESARRGSFSSQSTSGTGPIPNPYAQRPYEAPRFEQDSRSTMNGYTHNPAPQYHFGSKAAIPHAGGQSSFGGPRYPQPYERREQIGQRGDEKSIELSTKEKVQRDLNVWGVSKDLSLVRTALIQIL